VSATAAAMRGKGMILTVTLNPCVHHILAHEEPENGQVVRKPVRSFFQPGGKGLNAARVAATMGGEILALTTWGDVEGSLLLREMAFSGVPVRAVEVSRPTRISTCIYDMTTGSFMELLEAGVELSREEVDALFDLFLESLPRADTVALSGSSPCRNADDFFQKAAVAAREAGCRVVVDTYGASLVNAVKATPHMIKLNTQEIRSSFGIEIRGEEDVFSFAASLKEQGIGEVLVTDGDRGAYLFQEKEIIRIRVPPIRSLHAIGSGDAMLGALLARLQKGDNLMEACRWGAAAGAVNAGRLEVCTFSRTLVEALQPLVSMEAVT